MQPNPQGPVDPEVPILLVESDERPLAVVMSYACHPTTMGGYEIGGDYPGFAQEYVEREIPGCAALFATGCAGDVKTRNIGADGKFQNGPLEVVRDLGSQLGREVVRAVNGELDAVSGAVSTAMETIDLALQAPPTRAQAEAAVASEDKWRANWGRQMLAIMDSGGEFVRSRPFGIQSLRIGDDFLLIALSGEVCVGIGQRIKRAIPHPRPVVLAYANDVAGYIACRRQFPEGGYEVDGYYIYGLWPAPYQPQVEDLIVAKVKEMVGVPNRPGPAAD